MATTTANKHGLRKAAQERTNKHAQRTPLPPKGGVTPVEVPANAERYGKMTQEQLWRKAISLGIDLPSTASKGKLLTAILAHERTSSPTSVQMQAVSARVSRKEPNTEAGTFGLRSVAKATAVRDVMRQNGWETSLTLAEGTTEDEDIWELTGRRGDEVLWISWTQGTLTTEPMPTYTIADRTIKLRNASAVKQYAARAPEVGPKELQRVASNRFFRRKPTEPKRAPLPFDPNLATDEEVLSILLGQTVTWHNQYREMEETAQVGIPGGRQPVEIREREGGDRIVSFCCPQYGFRAFALSQLTRVTGGRRGQVKRGRSIQISSPA